MSGSQRRVELVYHQMGSRLWRALLAYSADPEIASDAVAEAFAQALAREDSIEALEPWLWRAAFKIAAGDLKSRRATLHELPELSYEMEPPADHLVNALRVLPENQRLCVVLHDYADRPTKEIASSLGIGVGTVHVHLSRGRRRLRHLLEETDD